MTQSISRLLKRREPGRPELAAALERLDQLAADSPSLREAVALQSAILRATDARAAEQRPIDMAQTRAAEKLGAGVPLLRGEVMPFSPPVIEAALLRMCRAAGGQGAEIAAAIGTRALHIETLARQALDGQAIAIRERAAELGIDGELLCVLLRFSLFPALAAAAAWLAPLLASARWEQGYCPVCGSWPLLAEQRGLEQARFLRCGLCAAEWAVDRLLCPFCGSRDHNDLGYLYVEGQEHQRAATCESCRGYVKVLAALAPTPPLELAILDLATIHLDLVALERGYAAPA